MSNKNKNILLGVLIVGIISMTVAFAALSTRLNINGTAKVSSFRWQIVIDDWTKVNNVSSLVSGSTNTAEEVKAGTPTADTTSVSGLEVAFKKTGDVVKYNFNIENKGTIDAELDSFHLNTTTDTDASKKVTCEKNGSSTECPALAISVTCNNEAPTIGSALNVNDSIPCTYTVGYNEVNDTNGYEVEEITIKNLGMSFTYKEKSNSGSTPVVQNDYICKRATSLHKDTCNRDDYGTCMDWGYSVGDEIEFGTIGTSDYLETGEALDCKVNTSGDYTERFYYVGSYYDTTTKTFDDSYAVLIYYKPMNNGQLTTYSTGSTTLDGPTAAVNLLPTSSTWNNVSLKKSKRQLLNDNDEYVIDEDEGYVLDEFDYGNHTARFLTYQEMQNAFYTTSIGIENSFMAENSSLIDSTKYESDRSYLETAYDYTTLYTTDGLAYADSIIADVRPVIEVPKNRIKLD